LGLGLKFLRASSFGLGMGRSLRISATRATVSDLCGELPKSECFMTASRHCRRTSCAIRLNPLASLFVQFLRRFIPALPPASRGIAMAGAHVDHENVANQSRFVVKGKKVLPGEPMIELATECRQRAQECRRESERASTTTDKAAWLSLAEEWTRLAQDLDLGTDESDITERRSRDHPHVRWLPGIVPQCQNAQGHLAQAHKQRGSGGRPGVRSLI